MVTPDDDHWTTQEIPDRHFIYTNIHYHISYVLTHVHIWIILLHHTQTHWISVTFLNSST